MKLRMRTKILLLCLFSTLAALIVQTVMFQRASTSLLDRQTRTSSYRSLQNMQSELTAFFKKIEGGMVKIYNDRTFMTDLSGDASAEELRKTYYRLAYEVGTQNFATTDMVLALYLYNADHEIVSTYRKAITPRHHYPTDIYADPMYNGAVVQSYFASDQKGMLISSYYNPYRQRDIVRFAVKIYDPDSLDDKIGYIICDVDSGALEKIMEKYIIYDQTYLWLQPMGDRPIHAVGSLEEQSRNYQEAVSDCIARGAPEELDGLSGKNNELFRVSWKDYNLSACSVMPQEILRQSQMMLTRNLILTAALMGVFMTALAAYLTRSLARPLEQLTDTMTKIRSGQTQLRASYASPDEIGQLGEEFNKMLDEIESLISREYENQLLLNKAEYKALQAQINPHFLYNTLDTMSSIASIQDCEVVSILCQSLSGIFRYSLDMKHPQSTLAKEIDHLKKYIYVMNVRMREEVRYRFHIEEALLQDCVPRISIQPLVENALNHGLKNKHGEKTVEIRAWDEDGILCISVTDNGVGMDSQAINRKLEENDPELVESGNSIGIYNINARIKMFYGKEYGLHVDSRPGEGACVTLRIPRRKTEELSGWEKPSTSC